MGVSSGTEIWKSSSRGYPSRISVRSWPSWLSGVIPAASSTLASLRRSTGTRVMLSWYAACVNSPRKRCSPTTSPASLTRLTAM